mmetsp:Transcript_43843/g.121388  ORF Transcript_43843/g.121388 Transcript_43843/m.121388 type:complete len:254 (+) Transcript_43843:244-1005(+)
MISRPLAQRMPSCPSQESEMFRRTPREFCWISSHAWCVSMILSTTATPSCRTTDEMPLAEIERFHSIERAFFWNSPSSRWPLRITCRIGGTPPADKMCACPSPVEEMSQSMSTTNSSMRRSSGWCRIVASSTAAIEGPSERKAAQCSSESQRFQRTPRPFFCTATACACSFITPSTTPTPPACRMVVTPSLEYATFCISASATSTREADSSGQSARSVSSVAPTPPARSRLSELASARAIRQPSLSAYHDSSE